MPEFGENKHTLRRNKGKGPSITVYKDNVRVYRDVCVLKLPAGLELPGGQCLDAPASLTVPRERVSDLADDKVWMKRVLLPEDGKLELTARVARDAADELREQGVMFAPWIDSADFHNMREAARRRRDALEAELKDTKEKAEALAAKSPKTREDKARLRQLAADISAATEQIAAEAPMADAVEVNGMVSFAGKTEDYISVLHENRNVDDWESRVGAEDKSRTVYAYHVFVAARELEEAVDARRAEMREEREHRPFQPQRERTDEEKAALEARRARMRERNAPLRKALGIPESMSFKEYAKLNDIPKSVSVGEWARARGLYPPRDGGNVR